MNETLDEVDKDNFNEVAIYTVGVVGIITEQRTFKRASKGRKHEG